MSALISYVNLVDASTLSTPATVISGFPLANVQTRQLSATTRLSAAGEPPNIVVDFGATRTFRLISIMGYSANLARDNLVVSCRSGTSGAWSTVTPALTIAVLDRTAPVLHCLMPGQISARQVNLQFGALDSGYPTSVTIGRLWLGDAIVLPNGVDGGWSIGFNDSGKLDVSAGLQAYESRRPRPRTLRMSITGMDCATAFGFTEETGVATNAPYMQDMQMAIGTTGELIVIPRMGIGPWVARLGIYGHLAQTFDIQHQAGPNYSAELTVVEER